MEAADKFVIITGHEVKAWNKRLRPERERVRKKLPLKVWHRVMIELREKNL